MYLKAFNRSLPLNRREYEDGFKELRAAQEILAGHGIPLIFILNPNVLMLYPEVLPEKYKARREGSNGYDWALELIKNHSIVAVDTYSYLREAQPRFPIRFFEPTGSHWNEIGSCLAVEKVGELLSRSWNEPLPNPECHAYEMRFPPAPAELDLVKIANLLRPRDTFQPGAYLKSFPVASLEKPRRVLLVGTSFLFGLERQLLRRKIAKSTTLLFYYRQIRRNGKGPFKELDRTKITREVLLSYDAIIVDANVSNPVGVGYGFLKTVRRLFSEKAEVKVNK